MPTPISVVYFIVKLLKKGSSCPYNNRDMTHQTDENHLNNMAEYFGGVVKLALYWNNTRFYDVSLGACLYSFLVFVSEARFFLASLNQESGGRA